MLSYIIQYIWIYMDRMSHGLRESTTSGVRAVTAADLSCAIIIYPYWLHSQPYIYRTRTGRRWAYRAPTRACRPERVKRFSETVQVDHFGIRKPVTVQQNMTLSASILESSSIYRFPKSILFVNVLINEKNNKTVIDYIFLKTKFFIELAQFLWFDIAGAGGMIWRGPRGSLHLQHLQHHPTPFPRQSRHCA